MRYQVSARRIDDRPDGDGWMSSGRDMPTFWVEAASAGNAAMIAHDVAGHGVSNLTRTVVQVYREETNEATGKITEEFVDSTQWWADGRMVKPVHAVRRYRRAGRDLARGASLREAEDDADQVVWTTSDGTVWLRVERGPRGKWRIAFSYRQLRPSDYRRLFDKPDGALRVAQDRAGTVVAETQ